jgi:hypothetical protein
MQGEQDDIIVTDVNMEECHCFDQTHREVPIYTLVWKKKQEENRGILVPGISTEGNFI